ncbi:response regulator [Gaetbulibacter aquiaggeris]|uniref:histidine kinase n=1 Tax=Gaetbulibacter aquiaggeris TaxID=1735373 RepID=A0ABW7MQR6_9FLAO
MAFLFQSMRSFKVRITLIFFTFILLIIVLFIGFTQLQKKLDYLPMAVSDLQDIKFDFSRSFLNYQSTLLENNQALHKTGINKNNLDFFVTNLNSNKEKLINLKKEIYNHSFVFDNDIIQIIEVVELFQNSTSKNLFNPSSENQLNLNAKIDSLIIKLNKVFQEKKKALYNNGLILFVLIAILMVVVAYFLARRMTNDFSRLKTKIDDINNHSDKLLLSKIDDVNSLDKSFEILKTKVRRLESDLEEAIKISEYKSVFLANMSYEIRTPLNSVLGMINMLKQSQLTTDQQIQLEIAEYSSEHVMQLVSMILDNSKVEGGKIELELSAIDLKSDLSKLVKVFEYEAWDSGLDFEFKFLADENEKFLLLGDLKRIKQIITNLMSNAIKFTNSGKVSLVIDQTVGPDDYQIVTFYIKDTGIGIPPEKAKRIFADSENNHLSITDYYGGTGLGLTASSQLIKLMGGELKLESKENEGSIFYFSIQLQKTLNLKREKLEPSPDLLNQFDYKFNVLVAEDNKMNQKVIKFLLEQQGADCTFVKNGSDAVKLFNILDFDMVFMDIFMPEMDGYEATKLIKASEKYAKHEIPIIAVSASAFEEDIQNAKKAGIDDFLAKPIESDKLKELLIKYAPKDKSAIS